MSYEKVSASCRRKLKRKSQKDVLQAVLAKIPEAEEFVRTAEVTTSDLKIGAGASGSVQIPGYPLCLGMKVTVATASHAWQVSPHVLATCRDENYAGMFFDVNMDENAKGVIVETGRNAPGDLWGISTEDARSIVELDSVFEEFARLNRDGMERVEEAIFAAVRNALETEGKKLADVYLAKKRKSKKFKDMRSRSAEILLKVPGFADLSVEALEIVVRAATEDRYGFDEFLTHCRRNAASFVAMDRSDFQTVLNEAQVLEVQSS